MSIVGLTFEAAAAVPAVVWHWDDETDILSGGFAPTSTGRGPTAALELTDEEGAIIVLDVVDGVLCGLYIVVWPDIVTDPDLAVPKDALSGRLYIPEATAELPAIEVDAPLLMATSMDESIIHLRVGAARPTSVVRIADHLLVEMDASHTLAGFWLLEVPPLPPLAEEDL